MPISLLDLSINLTGQAAALVGLENIASTSAIAYMQTEQLVQSLDSLVAKQIAVNKEMEITKQ